MGCKGWFGVRVWWRLQEVAAGRANLLEYSQSLYSLYTSFIDIRIVVRICNLLQPLLNPCPPSV